MHQRFVFLPRPGIDVVNVKVIQLVAEPLDEFQGCVVVGPYTFGRIPVFGLHARRQFFIAALVAHIDRRADRGVSNLTDQPDVPADGRGKSRLEPEAETQSPRAIAPRPEARHVLAPAGFEFRSG